MLDKVLKLQSPDVVFEISDFTVHKRL